MTATLQQATAARRYRIERYLTEGGMGAIYIGKKLGPVGFEKEVVLKQLLPEYTARPEFRDLFFREAKISATLDHTNIVHTFDLVESDESLFIVMEYVRGVDLRTIIRRAKLRRRDLAPAAALHVCCEILSGLAYAHARRTPNGASMAIIHRDVSPSNILCSAQGEVKLSDFGIAKAATHSSVFYRVRGKVGYMSPEQARNEPIDHRSDLYSLAVCLYEALTAERLFVGDLSTPADVIYSQPIVPPSEKRPGLPKALDTVLATALAAKPDHRYQDATAFAGALRQVAHKHGLAFSPPKLAEHLRFILGRNPAEWLSDDPGAHPSDPSTQKLPAKELPARELEGKEAKSIGLVLESKNLYDSAAADVVSPPSVSTRNSPGGFSPFRAPRPNEADAADKEDDTTRRLADPLSAMHDEGADPGDLGEHEEPTRVVADKPLAVSEDLPMDDDEATIVRDRNPDPGPTPPPASRSLPGVPSWGRPIPPPPPVNALSGLPPESPFDDFPPTPAPLFDGIESAGTPPPLMTGPHPPAAYPMPGMPPPGRPGGLPAVLPRPGGYLDPTNPALRQPPAPPPALYDPGMGGPFGSGGFTGPETVDFGRYSEPIVTKQKGPPGLVVLIVLLAALAGGAKLGEIVTRADVAALAAQAAPDARQK
jgi:eukaryotic-like serine/threonine-protein kinase